MKNSSPNQMLMISTRLGDNSKLIITGDLNQSDRMDDNGLKDLVKKIEAYPLNCTEISTIYFQQNDIQRSPIVSKILDIYEYKIRKLPIPNVNQNKSKKYNKKIDNDAAIIPLSDMRKVNNKK